MMLPAWLQEIRDLLHIHGYESRREAMRWWEDRWLLDLHVRDLLEPEYLAQNTGNILDRRREYVRDALGRSIAKVMVTTTVAPSIERSWSGVPFTEVRGDFMAIRAVPEEQASVASERP